MRTIDIYSTPTCPFCRTLKGFLDEKKIAYTDHDVATDEAKREEMMSLSGSMSVPVVIFDKGKENQEVQIGFVQSAVEKALGL
jgi:glutaredoxin 3